jgi:hypothetical protein
MPTKRLTGDLAQTSVGINPGIAIPGGADQVIGLTDWTMTIKTKSIDGSTTDDDAWEDWLPSMSSWTAKAKFVYLMGEPSQMTNIIQATIGTGRRTSSQWNFFLDSESGDDSFSGQAFISGLGISSIIGRTVTMDVTLQGRGPLNLRNLASFHASLVLPAGHATKGQSHPLSGYTWGAIWSEFVLCGFLPDDAVIQGIYPVIIASAVVDICFQNLAYGVGVSEIGLGGGLTGAGFSFPFGTLPMPGSTFASTEFWAGSIGTSLSALAGQKIGMSINSSLSDGGPLSDEISTTGLGFAISYISAAPAIDPLLPPPFAVPAGQGLVWALPFSVELLGPPSTWGTSTANAALAEE